MIKPKICTHGYKGERKFGNTDRFSRAITVRFTHMRITNLKALASFAIGPMSRKMMAKPIITAVIMMRLTSVLNVRE